MEKWKRKRRMIEVFEKKFKETYESPLNTNFTKRTSKAKTFRGRLLGDLAKAKNDNNLTIEKYLENLIKDFNRFYPQTIVEIKKWKGKSGIISITKGLGEFIVLRARKRDKDSEVKYVENRLLFDDVDLIIKSLFSSKNKKVKTRHIAEGFCRLKGMDLNGHNAPLFEGNMFIWDNAFSDRKLHTFLNDCLGLLDYYKITKYRGGFSEIKMKNKLVSSRDLK